MASESSITHSGTVTLLFTDLVNSTQLLSRAGDESGHRIFEAHHQLLSDAVKAYGGHEVKWLGDGAMVVFPSAADAVRCAIAMQQRAWRAPGERLQIRVGLHVGEALKKESDYFGTAVVIARRLCDRANAGQILCSNLVAGLLAGHQTFSFHDLGPMELKGFSTPTDACEVLYQHDDPAVAAQQDRETQPSAPRPTGNRRRAIVAGAGVLLLVAIIAGVVAWRRFASGPVAAPPAAKAPGVRSIAVLPLENLSGDPAQEYFADGMTDELITDLAKISGLRVISRTSVMKFKGEHREQLPEIAKALNVDTIVEGSVLRVGDKVRITAQLIDAPNDKHLWAESYERDSGDVLTLQDELASTIAQQIDVELTPNEQARFAKPRPVNPAALEAALKGRYFLLKQTSDGFQKANEYFEQAIKIAPDFAGGYVGLAAVYVTAADLVVSNQEAMPKAKELVATALRLDDTNAEAHSILGIIHWDYDEDWVASERENLRAIELGPGDSDAHRNYGYMLTWQARFEEAERELKLAQLLDPLDPINYVSMGQLFNVRGDYLNVRGDYSKALEQCRKAVEIDPNFWPSYSLCSSYSYAGMGNYGEALKALEKGVAIEPGPVPIAMLGVEFARLGNREQARKVLEQLDHLPAQTYVAPCYRAWVYLALGENNTAMDLEEKAHQERSGCMIDLKVNHAWDPLRSDPRFIALLKNVGLDK
jgi:TolB-like protein/class 3 adenylate cyclase/Flp pilus assembly protein TadD